MALWGSSGRSDLQTRIDDIQTSLASLGDMLGDGASRAGREAARGARSAGDTVSSTASNVSDSVGPALSDLRGQIESLMSIVGAVSSRFARRTADESRHAYNAVEEKVEDNAMLAVVAAAGVGFLLGAVLLGSVAASSSDSQTRRRPPARSAQRGRSRRAA